jgi:hypothetical protein
MLIIIKKTRVRYTATCGDDVNDTQLSKIEF